MSGNTTLCASAAHERAVSLQVDEDRSGTIDFKEFLSVIEKQKSEEATQNDETSTVEAFVALGGQVRPRQVNLEEFAVT